MKCGAEDHGVACPRDAIVTAYPVPRSTRIGPGLRGLGVPLCKTHKVILEMERSAFLGSLCPECFPFFGSRRDYD